MIACAGGRVVAVAAGSFEAEIPRGVVGAAARVHARDGIRDGVVTAARAGRVRIAPLDAAHGIAVGDPVRVGVAPPTVAMGMTALGRVVDARGCPLDGGAALRGPDLALDPPLRVPPVTAQAPAPCWTGIRAIDALTTLGRGQRIGIFGGAGVGKSTLLQAIMRNARADALVIALVGERGREIGGWIEALGTSRERATVVCATADAPAALRARAPLAAAAQAEYLRALGLHVLLVIDSLARYCAAMRELAALNGETVALRGYPPSAFAALGALLERAGTSGPGAVTAICSVLVEGDDDREPVADATRALLDGHLVLSRRVAESGRFPALDVPASCSRLFGALAAPGQRADALALRRALAALDGARDLRAVGAYCPGRDPVLDAAVAAEDAIEEFLRQGGQASPPARSLDQLAQLAAALCRSEEGDL